MVTGPAQRKRGLDWATEYETGLSGQPEVVAFSGISVRLWRLYAQAWLVCLLFPIIFLAQTPPAPARLLIALSGLVIFVVTYTWFMWPHPVSSGTRGRSGFRTSLSLLASLTALVLFLSLEYGNAFLWLFVGVSAAVGVALPARSAFIVVMALTLLTLGMGVGISGGIARTDWFQIIPLVLLVRGLGLDMVGMVRLSDALRELHTTRGELARRAVTEERLRLARDLHDLLGHTLSLITLKSELAGRLIERQPVQAAQEIHAVEHTARQGLREVREAIAGYRQPVLRRELDGARQMLEAAGMTCTVEDTAETLPPATDAVLAWAVREGVTNVIRHSRARLCTIRVKNENGKASAEVINDGYREPERDLTHNHTGSGLVGLTERVTAQGGQIEAGPLLSEGHPSFRLWVELPIQNDLVVERKSLE
jgi:two-component system sensor histidine kinase DesK